MMDLMPENFFLDLLDDSRGCCIFSSLCRFCKNSKSKCYVQEQLFVEWCNFYLRFVGCEINSLVDLWDWTLFIALLDGLGRERQLISLDDSFCKPEINDNWDIVQEYLIKENVIKSIISNGMNLFIYLLFFSYILFFQTNCICEHGKEFRNCGPGT